ncbi:nanos 1-like isoform X2, partial [Biomphalaria glabrata]
RQPVGRPIVGRPPIPPPIDPIAETMAYTQLWYSWESLNSINSNIGHFDLIKEFDDLCNLYHSCEGEQNMNMSSYIKMVLDMKAKRSTEKFNNFSEAVSKLDREQAELVEFLSAHSIEVHPICNSAGMPAFKNSKQIPKYPSSAFSPSVVTMSERKFPATLNECEDQILEITRFKMPDDEITWVGLKMLDSVIQNGETEEYYKSHNLKDAKGKIVCPTLRSFVCPYCKATGSNAHTASYCPSNADTVRTKHSPHKRYKDGYTRYSHGLKYTG